MTMLRAALLAVALLEAAPAADIVTAVQMAVSAGNFTLAEREIQSYRGSVGVTPQMLEALSWLARGALESKQYDRADSYATQTRKLSLEMLGKLGPEPVPVPLETALGAAIEVHAQVLAARGERREAVAFLKKELTAYRGSPLAPRIQKNINLLSLEGRLAPALDVSHWLGPKPVPLAALRGHAVLLFFWAHWCSDCKAEVPILARLMAAYGPRGLVLIGPTRHYGYTAAGDATPADETRYIELVREQYYTSLQAMPVPVSTRNFQEYGCSTTPTLVLIDKTGIVRLYHPGAMAYEALVDRIRRVLDPHAPRS